VHDVDARTELLKTAKACPEAAPCPGSGHFS
jgi:hypothetical protein